MAKKPPSPPPSPPPAPAPTPPPAAPRGHRVLRLRVSGGGFLNGLDLTFSPHLNCIVGARGMGKTTILELLRFAVTAKPLDSFDADFQRLIKANLKDAAVTLDVETKDGQRYTIERTQYSLPSVQDEQGQAVRFDLAQSGIFDLDVVGQNQIEAVARSPALQLELLDRVEPDRVRALSTEIAAVEAALKANAARILGLRVECSGLVDEEDKRAALELRLSALPRPSGAEAARVQRELELRTLRTREASAVDRLLAAAQRQRDALRTAGGQVTLQKLPPELADGVNKAPLRAAHSRLEFFASRVEQTLGLLHAEADQATAELSGFKAQLASLHETQEAVARDLLRNHEQEKVRADERLQIEQQLTRLDERSQQLAQLRKPVAELESERRQLRERLATLRDQRSKVRDEVARRLDLALAPRKPGDARIRVSLNAQSGRSGYRELLKKGLGRSERLVDAVLPLTPLRFASLVQEGQVEPLAQELAIERPAVRAQEAIDRLKDQPVIYEIDACGFEDVPHVALESAGGQPKEAQNLSTGQRCTTILPILLHEGPKPLLIDQPEDHIDNEYVNSTICSTILRVKATRQLIFVTHNPNIPVLGLADAVVVLDGNDAHAHLKLPPGNVDQEPIRDEIERVLEGGADAFAERMRRYGY